MLGFGTVWTFDHLLPVPGAGDGACFERLRPSVLWRP